MKIVTKEKFFNWILNQPDDREVRMEENSYHQSYCGCLMVQYATDNDIVPVGQIGLNWGCGYSEWCYEPPKFENGEEIFFAQFENDHSLYGLLPLVDGCENFGQVKQLIPNHFLKKIKN